MFSIKQKNLIAEAVEKAILGIDHPEMPKEKPKFTLHIDGKESWSWADIKPNWSFNKDNPPLSTFHNEIVQNRPNNQI